MDTYIISIDFIHSSNDLFFTSYSHHRSSFVCFFSLSLSMLEFFLSLRLRDGTTKTTTTKNGINKTFSFTSYLFDAVWMLKQKADDFLEDILNLEAGLEAADRNRSMDISTTTSNHQTLPAEVIFN